MGNYRRRTSYESDHVLSSKAVARRKVRTTIGEELRRLLRSSTKVTAWNADASRAPEKVRGRIGRLTWSGDLLVQATSGPSRQRRIDTTPG
jgi:hypothetical protein